MENKDLSDILTSTKNGILKVVLNRPKRKNAITVSMYIELSKILQESIQNINIRAIVLTGAENFFSSGNDFSLSSTSDEGNLEKQINTFTIFVNSLITYPKLLIAIVNGPAIGIAVTMLPLFDMVYASDKAYFHVPFTSMGLVSEGCSSYTFPKIFGPSKAGDMLYLGYKMNAFEAKQYGFISEVYKHNNLDDVWVYLNKVSTLSMESIMAIKSLVRRWNKEILLEVNTQESMELIKCVQSSDFVERILSILSRKSKM